MGIGSKLKKAAKAAIKAPVENLIDTGKKLAQGDLAGAAKSAAMSTNPFGAQYAAGTAAVNASLTEATSDALEAAKAKEATLTPDPNALAESAAEEERKRRLRAPGRSQYVLNRPSNIAASLLG